MPHLKSILLVEDNLNDIELVLTALKKRNNLANNVVTTRHGGEALDYLYPTPVKPLREREGDDPIFILHST